MLFEKFILKNSKVSAPVDSMLRSNKIAFNHRPVLLRTQISMRFVWKIIPARKMFVFHFENRASSMFFFRIFHEGIARFGSVGKFQTFLTLGGAIIKPFTFKCSIYIEINRFSAPLQMYGIYVDNCLICAYYT